MSVDRTIYVGWVVTFTPAPKSPIAWYLNDETDEDEIAFMLRKRPNCIATPDDIKLLQKGHAVCPEYLPTKKTTIMAPGYVRISDVGRSDGFIKTMPEVSEPSEEWLNAVRRIFAPTELKYNLGMCMEVA